LEIIHDNQTKQLRINPRTRTVIDLTGDTFEIHVIGVGRWRLFESKVSQKSSQKFVARNRAPRVQIEYEVERYGTEKKIQLPFVMGVMADLTGKPAEELTDINDRNFLEIDVDNFNERFKAMKPRVAFQVPNVLTGKGNISLDITFEGIDDFSPVKVAEKVDALNKLLQVRKELSKLMMYMDGKSGAEKLIGDVLNDETLLKSLAKTSKPPSDAPNTSSDNSSRIEDNLIALLKNAFKPKSDGAQQAIENAIRTLAEQALEQTRLIADKEIDAIQKIQSIIELIDKRLSGQINLIMHHENFQKLEGSWRGMHYLVNNTETDEMLKIKVLNITKREVHGVLKKYQGIAWDQSPIFNKIYDHEFGQLGGEPYGCLIGDYEFDNGPPDVEFLQEISKTCAEAHVPFIAAASPQLMNMDSWQELADPRDLSRIFQTPDYASWRTLRESAESRYIGLTLLRFLSRLPYGANTVPIEEFDFEEDVTNADNSRYTWSNSAYLMAVNINRAFKLYGWCSRIRGIEAGGAVEGLPTYTFPT
ncbi:MAG: type VI secretion system contractile sheath large subunit, partial [Pseudomonadota bacterium]